MNTKPLQIPHWELSPRWATRPETGAREDVAPARQRRCVQFTHGANRVCLPLESVERVVPKLGKLVPLAGDDRVAGIALVAGDPLLVIDLEEAALVASKAGIPLEERPALVVPFEGGRIALAVHGPADLIESSFDARPLAGEGALSIEGFVDSTVPVLAMAGVSSWLSMRLGVRS